VLRFARGCRTASWPGHGPESDQPPAEPRHSPAAEAPDAERRATVAIPAAVRPLELSMCTDWVGLRAVLPNAFSGKEVVSSKNRLGPECARSSSAGTVPRAAQKQLDRAHSPACFVPDATAKQARGADARPFDSRIRGLSRTPGARASAGSRYLGRPYSTRARSFPRSGDQCAEVALETAGPGAREVKSRRGDAGCAGRPAVLRGRG